MKIDVLIILFIIYLLLAAISTSEPITSTNFHIIVKVKFSHYRPGVSQRVGRGIDLLFHDRGTRRG